MDKKITALRELSDEERRGGFTPGSGSPMLKCLYIHFFHTRSYRH